MRLKTIFATITIAAGICCATSVRAQATAASGSVIVIPLVAQTQSYTSEITVQNPNAAPITVNVSFYIAVGLTQSGLLPCNQLSVPASSSVPFDLPTQCPTLDTSISHYGMLVLADAATQQIDTFFVYSRTQTPGGNGFSVEGFPIGAFSGTSADVVGLKRQAAAPTYQSNCFVGALGEAINYQVRLFDGTTNEPFPNTLSGTLQPFQQIRYLDVFTQAGAAAGDYSNVRANFTATTTDLSPGSPAFVGFCTVQESTYFGADFRIAKSIDANSDAMRRVVCLGQDQCGTVSGTNPEQISGKTNRNIYSMIITQPDFVACNLVAASGDLPNLQTRIRGPGQAFDGTTIWPSTSPYSSGGAGKQSFYISTGPRDAVAGGIATRWFVDVEQTSSSTATGPISYGITCLSGNGTEVPWFRATAVAF